MEILKPIRLQSFQAKITKVPENFVLRDSLYFEHKEDGRRLTIYKHETNPVAIYRKPINVWEDIKNNTSITSILRNIPYGTILDGEAMPEDINGKSSDVIADIKKGTATFKLFSIPLIRGEKDHFAGTRLRKKLQELGAEVNCPRILTLAEILSSEMGSAPIRENQELKTFNGLPLETLKRVLINYIRQEDIEGLIIRDRNTDLAHKYKQAKTVTCIVTAKERGSISGKYFLTLGSLTLSLYNPDGKLVEIGKCSGFSDIQRDEIWEKDISELDPVEVEYDSLTKYGKLRFAQFKCFRSDRDPKSCTLDKLQ